LSCKNIQGGLVAFWLGVLKNCFIPVTTALSLAIPNDKSTVLHNAHTIRTSKSNRFTLTQPKAYSHINSPFQHLWILPDPIDNPIHLNNHIDRLQKRLLPYKDIIGNLIIEMGYNKKADLKIIDPTYLLHNLTVALFRIKNKTWV